MRTITTYSWYELEHGTCTCCGQISDEIVKTDGRCIDCIEEERFIGMTMAHAEDPYTCSSPDLENW